MARREFTKAVQAQIVLRATNAEGMVACEGCGLVLGKRPYNIDHTIADGLQVDKSSKLTAKDGKLLGKECCHDPKTFGSDIPAIAEAKRRESKHLGIKARKQPIPQPPKAEKPARKTCAGPRRSLYAARTAP